MATRAELVRERVEVEGKLAKVTPALDEAVERALAKVRALEADLEAARRAVGQSAAAKGEVVGPLDARLLGIAAELRRSAPAQVVSDLREWLDLRASELQHRTPAQSFTYAKPDGLGTASVQRVYSTSLPSLRTAIERVLQAQKEAGDGLALEVDVEARAAAIRAEVAQAVAAIREEKVEGLTLGDKLVGMASQALAGLRG